MQHYRVSNVYNRESNILTNVQPTARCNLWDEYICATVTYTDQLRGWIKVNEDTKGKIVKCNYFLKSNTVEMKTRVTRAYEYKGTKMHRKSENIHRTSLK